ncbi:hypothetical protein DSO57_1010399 [Entomophthora muscae]|uniref:Uncharacterized protein n=1 Tax=Entomophthora muscae TaxID=34485 RepID=A0ACC2RLD4_9FUNG|nr:hypothetical protein DSO57_1010399 [Entomophthora muscae]
MKTAALITLGVVVARPLNEQASLSGITKASEQMPSATHSTAHEETADTLTADDIDQVKTVLQNKKLMRRAAMIYRDPCPDCTIL